MSTQLKGQQQVKAGTVRSSEYEGLHIISHYHLDRSLVLKSIQSIILHTSSVRTSDLVLPRSLLGI